MDSMSLTPRDRDIVERVAAGRTSKEIARDVGLSEAAVKWHVHSVMRRLGAKSRSQAVAIALRRGLLGR